MPMRNKTRKVMLEARKERNKYSLKDLHVAPSSNFSLPTDEERLSVEVGELVQAIFMQEGAISERMWIEVTSAADGAYRGKVDNIPVNMRGLKLDDPVEF